MDRSSWYLVGAGLGLGFLVWKYGNPIVAGQIAEGWVSSLFTRGNVLSYGSLSGGIVQEIPEVLQDQATAVLGFQADSDTYSLARMGRSEGVDGMEYRMHVALNDLASLGSTYGMGVYSSITALMVHSKETSANGHYSAQNLGKRYSTAHDPYEGDYALAQKVISDHDSGIDPTGGATKFVDKSGPFYDDDGNKITYDQLVANWATEGLTPSNLPGATTNFVVFTTA